MTGGVLALPRFIALHGGTRLNRYLRFVNEQGLLHSHLQLSGVNVVSPYTKFELQRSERGGDIMHIRSCYNNKYFVRNSRTDPWVVATADEPEEDTTKWNCTLFRVTLHDESRNSYRFQHVASGDYLGTMYPVSSWSEVLHLTAFVNERLLESFVIINMNSLVTLPRFVAFKGPNDRYLRPRIQAPRIYAEFGINDKFDPSIRYEILTRSDGSFSIRSLHFSGRFLRRGLTATHNYITLDGDENTNVTEISFWAVKVNRNHIAIRSLSNNNFCTSRGAGLLADCLNASNVEIDRFCLLEVEEIVASRRIYDVVFRTEDARIYNHSDGISLVKTVNNPTESEQDGNVRFTYTQTQSSTWNVSHGWGASVSTTISTGVPVLANGEIKIETTYSGNYSWGETREESIQDVSSTDSIIPPMTKKVLTVVLTRGAIDIPFSYTQHDTLLSGQSDIRRFDDGIFTGVNTHIVSDADEVILPSTALINDDDHDQQIPSSTIPVIADSTATVTKDDEQNLSSTTPLITDSTTA